LFSPFVKPLSLFSPFTKGGLRGISINLPQPLFYKEGGTIGICKGRRPEVGRGFRNLPHPFFYKEGRCENS